jgi:hypothetical protein
MNDYDIYLRHAAVHDGEWVGFGLAWKGTVGKEGLVARPHLRWRPWVLDPANPDDPTLGAWGVWQWRFDVAMLDAFVGLLWTPPGDGRDAADMRADLHAYIDLPALDLKDVDGAEYVVKMTAFREQCIAQYDAGNRDGGWLAQVEFAETTA